MKYVCLSFDDGPNLGDDTTMNNMLDLLEENQVPASFFLIGNKINEENKKVIQRAISLGCDIQNHSWTHPAMAEMTVEQIIEEYEKCDKAIVELTGKKAEFFRPPYISVGAQMYEAIKVPFICGRGCMDWDMNYDANYRHDEMIKMADNGVIFLLHVSEGNQATYDAVKRVIPELKAQGYEFVNLPDLYKKCGVNPNIKQSLWSIAQENLKENYYSNSEALESLFEEIYFKDIEERYTILLPEVLRNLTSSICSSIGSLTNASKIARTVSSAKGKSVDSETISAYLEYLQDSFLFSKAERYDVKGKRYFDYPSKYYCTDVGLRNIRLGLRQQEETHILENILYNELLYRGYSVDVGVVEVVEKNEEGKREKKLLEIDFIARKGTEKYYIQSALSMDDPEKQEAELKSLRAVKDSFKKIVISKSYGKSWVDEEGILRINMIDFLLDANSLRR